ncbi:GNAT family N-acetyltransferase [Micromonospora sp. NPDC002389]|uniref:GNAT family N-acetyltransferase n=1 Tax=Micromonospora sp. NPDC002389 TaxID=3154272 RepID=UPI00333048A8
MGDEAMGDSAGAAGERLVDVGAMLRVLRRRADLSQRELAALSGVPQSTVARIESGRGTDPRFRTVQRLVSAAGGTLGFLAGDAHASGRARVAEAACANGGAGAAGAACAIGGAGAAGAACAIGGSRAAGDACADGRGRAVSGAGGNGRASGDDRGSAASDAEFGDTWRDAAGRRYPAHLDARRVRTLKDWPGAWWANWYSLPPERWPLRVPEVTFDLNRRYRDERRLRERLLAEVRIRRVTDGVPETCWRLVAELSDGDPVGELRAHERSLDLLHAEDLGDQRELVLDGVLVAPGLQRLGIGRRLVGRLVEETRRVGLRAVCATAESGGVRFLMACGFRVESSRPVSLRLEHRRPLEPRPVRHPGVQQPARERLARSAWERPERRDQRERGRLAQGGG